MLTPAQVGGALAQALHQQTLSPDALAELQERKLRSLLQSAVTGSPFYARLYRGIDVPQAALTDLPTITKEIVQRHFDEIITDRRVRLEEVQRFAGAATPQGRPFFLDEFAVLQSSGTSGLRGWYVWDGVALAEAIAAGHRQSHREGVSVDRQRIAAIIQVHPTDASYVLLSQVPASVGEKRLLDIRQEFPRILDELNAFQPTLLAAYPYVHWLLAEAARDGRLRIRPERVTSSGDVLTASDRAAIRTAFGVEPFNYYCSTEVPYLAWECKAHDGLHVNADYVLLESVDAGNRPVPPGTLGDKVLVTNLSNQLMPLIRYEMSDQVEYTTAPCPCGCRLPRIRTVAGRVENVLSLPDAAGRPLRLIAEYIDDFVGGVDGVARYQVIQEAAARLTVNVIVRAGGRWEDVGRAVEGSLQRCFRKYGVDPAPCQIDLRRREELEPVEPSSRKVCCFWNRVR